MNRLDFWGFLSGCSLLVIGCAESAIPSDQPVADDDGTVEPVTGSDASTLDGATIKDAKPDTDEPTTGERSDASSPTADAGIRDAGFDAGKTADAGDPATAKDASKPVVDSGAPPLTCSNGQTTCNNACVDTTSDAANCGGCGKACASGQTCQANQCTGGTLSFNVPSGCQKKTLGDHGYAFCTAQRTWSDARNACLGANLDLAIVTDQAENDFVKANGESWLGANDQKNEGSWVEVVPGSGSNVTGASATYLPWASGEPNNTTKCDGFQIPVIQTCFGKRTDEDCGMLSANGAWNDADCTETRGFVCETY